MASHEQLQRIDELTRKMEAMHVELTQLQEERDRFQKMQENAEDSTGVVGDSQKLMANVNKLSCNPLVGAALNYALTTNKQVIDKPTTIKDQLTSLAQKFDTKLKVAPLEQPLINNTNNHVKTCSAATQFHVVSSTVDEKVQKTTSLAKNTSSIGEIGSQRNMTMGDAVYYVYNVKRVLLNDKKHEIFQQFLDVLFNFKNGKYNIPDVEAKVKELFEDYPHFITGFQQYSLTGHQTHLPTVITAINEKKAQEDTKNIRNKEEICSAGKAKALKVEDALSYLDNIKKTFEPQVYNEFLDVMKDFKGKCLDTPGVIKKIKELFKGHPEFIIGFNKFLPPGYEIDLQADFDAVSKGACAASVQNAKKVLRNSSKEELATEAPIDTEVYSQPENIETVYHSQVSGYVQKVFERFQNEPKKFNSFLKIIQTFKKSSDQIYSGSGDNDVVSAKIELLQQLAELFVNNEDLLKEFLQHMHC